MYLIDLIAIGKLKENWSREAQRDFMAKIGPFSRLTVTEVESEPMTPTVRERESMAREGDRLLKRLPSDACVIALERTGRRFSSPAFADLIRDKGGTGRRLIFLVGGAAGLDSAVLQRANQIISLSEMTFTHEMARIFLWEQLYRAMTIIAGKKYHY